MDGVSPIQRSTKSNRDSCINNPYNLVLSLLNMIRSNIESKKFDSKIGLVFFY